MADVVDIKKNKPISKEAIKLFNFGTSIDDLIIEMLKAEYTRDEIAAVLGHRIGELLRQDPNKIQIIDFVIETMKIRAGV